MSRNLPEIAKEIESKIAFSILFQELFPDHYQAHGNSLCPFHDDHNPSFSLNDRYGKCFSGCKPAKGDIYGIYDLYMHKNGCNFVTAVQQLAERCGISMENRKRKLAAVRPENITATYDYVDESGTVLYQVVRYEAPGCDKTFRQRVPDETGGWKTSKGCMDGVRLVLYQLPRVMAANVVWVVEGEKDVGALESIGLTATCNPMGAGKWPGQREKHRIHEPLQGKTVNIIADNDPTGRTHADDVARSLVGLAKQVKIINLPDLPEKGDVSDFLQMKGSEAGKHFLSKLVEKIPDYQPPILGSGTADGDGFSPPHGPDTKFNRLLALFKASGAAPFLDQHGTAWVTLKEAEHWKNIRIQSGPFARFLLRSYVDAFNEGIGRETISQVCDYVEASTPETRQLSNRFHWDDENNVLFIDLGTPTWESVRINADGYEVVRLHQPPFKRFAHQKPLPIPEPGGTVKEVLEFLPVKDEDCKALLMVWLVLAPLGHIPRPGVIMHGCQGSGKSTACGFLRALTDPADPNALSLSQDHTQLVQFLDHHAVPILDNLQRLPQWASDDLCRAVTGGGFTKRVLYEDDDDFLYQFIRTFLLNGINIPGTAPDLLDRVILIDLSRVDENERKTEKALQAEFGRARARIFGAQLTALSQCIRLVNSVSLERLPRMADWTLWGCAAANALGIGANRFLEAYQRNRKSQNDEIVRDHPVCVALTDFMAERHSWEGQASELLELLTEIAEKQRLVKDKRWPRASQALSRRMTELSHNLKEEGILVERRTRGRGNDRQRLIRVETVREIPSPSLQRSQFHDINDIDGDDVVPIPFTPNVDTVPETDGVPISFSQNPALALSRNDGNGGNDISGTCSGMGAHDEKRLVEWGCRDGCISYRCDDEGTFCHQFSGDLDLTVPDFICPKVGSASASSLPW